MARGGKPPRWGATLRRRGPPAPAQPLPIQAFLIHLGFTDGSQKRLIGRSNFAAQGGPATGVCYNLFQAHSTCLETPMLGVIDCKQGETRQQHFCDSCRLVMAFLVVLCVREGMHGTERGLG